MVRENDIVIRSIISLAVSIVSFFLLNSQCAAAEEKKEAAGEKSLQQEQTAMLEEKWGVRPLSIRQAAEGYMLDFRYRVTDEGKAAPLFSHKIKPYLIDQATGAVMAVPDVPKVGSMRSTRKPLKDKNYAILFANPGKFIKPGNKVTVVIGDFRAENLVVE